VHGIYLVNLAAENLEHMEKSVASLAAALRFCEGSGALGTIFHVGSHKGAGFDETMPRIVAAMREALARAPGESWLIIENSAGAGWGLTQEEYDVIDRAFPAPDHDVPLGVI